MADGNKTINVYANDSANNFGLNNSYVVKIDITNPIASFGTNPVDNYNSSSSSFTFDLKGSDNLGINYLILYGNWTGSWIANQTNSSPINNTFWNVTVEGIPDGKWRWAVWTNDSVGNEVFTDTNRTFTKDTIKPLISYNPTAESNAVEVNRSWVLVNVSTSDNNLHSVRLNWQGANETFDTNSGSNYWENKTNLKNGNYTFFAWTNDSAGNYNFTDSRTSVVNATLPVASNPNANVTFIDSPEGFLNEVFCVNITVTPMTHVVNSVKAEVFNTTHFVNYTMVDNGVSCDGSAGDNIYGADVTVSSRGKGNWLYGKVYFDDSLNNLEEHRFTNITIKVNNVLIIYNEIESLGGNLTYDYVNITNGTLTINATGYLNITAIFNFTSDSVSKINQSTNFAGGSGGSDSNGTNGTGTGFGSKGVQFNNQPNFIVSSGGGGGGNAGSGGNGGGTDSGPLSGGIGGLFYGTNQSNDLTTGGAGGGGGDNSSGAGSGGNGGSGSNSLKIRSPLINISSNFSLQGSNGISGVGAGIFYASSGGGGGSGGTIILEGSNIYYNNSNVNLFGGSGGNSQADSQPPDPNDACAGGGGGGGSGKLKIFYESIIQNASSTINLQGGLKGTGASSGGCSGSNGVDGINGFIYIEQSNNLNFPPTVTLTSPANNSWSNSLINTFECSITDSGGLSNSTLYIWDSSNNLDSTTTASITGTSNTTSNSIILSSDDTYTWNCLAYDTLSNSAQSTTNRTLKIDTILPIITFNPSTQNGTRYNTNSIFVNVSITEANFKNITYYLYNSTNSTLNTTSSSTSFTTLNYTNRDVGTYYFNITVFEESGNQNTSLTRQAIIDYPSFTIDYINTTTGSQTFNFLVSNTSFAHTCFYTILNSTGQIDSATLSNTIFTCGTDTSETVSSFGEFSLVVSVNDSFSHVRTELDGFQIKQGITPGGGGGGSIGGLTQAVNFSIETRNSQDTLVLSLAKNSSIPRVKEFKIVNKGLTDIQVDVECNTQNVNKSSRGIEICDYVDFPETTFTVVANENNPEFGNFSINAPINAEYGDEYFFNILAKNNINQEIDGLSVKASVSYIGEIYKYSKIPGTEIDYPVSLSALITSIISFSGIFIIFIRFKRPITGLITSTLVSIPLFFLIILI